MIVFVINCIRAVALHDFCVLLLVIRQVNSGKLVYSISDKQVRFNKQKAASGWFQPEATYVFVELLSCKTSQIFFHILILNAIYHLTFPAIEDELSGDRAVAVLGLGAFLLVD